MRKIITFGRLLREVFLEPIILAFALYILFDHVREAWNRADLIGISSRFWSIITDFGDYYYIYVPFIVVVFLWAWWKKKRINEDNKDIGKLIEQLNVFTEQISKIESDISEIKRKLLGEGEGG